MHFIKESYHVMHVIDLTLKAFGTDVIKL